MARGNCEEPTTAIVLDPQAVTPTLDALKLRLSAQVAPRRWRSALATLAERLEAGISLDVAVEAARGKLPRELETLIVQAMRTPDPTRLLLDAVRVRETAQAGWRQFWQLIAYPLVLLGATLCVVLLFSLVLQSLPNVAEQFGFSGAESIQAVADDHHQAVVGLAFVYAWTLLTMVTIAIIGPRWAWTAIVSGMFLIGRPVRWLAMHEIVMRLEMFISQGLSVADSAGAVAESFRHSSQGPVTGAIAERVQQGVPLGSSLGDCTVAEGLSRPMLELIDLRCSDLCSALRDTAELLRALAEERCRTLAVLLPGFLILLIGSLLWSAVGTYLSSLAPLISMISSLA